MPRLLDARRDLATARHRAPLARRSRDVGAVRSGGGGDGTSASPSRDARAHPLPPAARAPEALRDARRRRSPRRRGASRERLLGPDDRPPAAHRMARRRGAHRGGRMTTATRAPARDEMLRDLLAWLNARFAPDGPPIVATTPLFAGRLIDSLRILELIAWTERAIGREIDDGDIRTDNFASAARIVDTFAAGDADAHR